MKNSKNRSWLVKKSTSRLAVNESTFRAVYLLLFILGFMSTQFAHAENDESKKASNLSRSAASDLWVVKKNNGKIISANASLKKEKVIYSDEEEADKISQYKIASLVGPILSVSFSFYRDGGGAHPGHRAGLETTNLDTGKSPVLLTDLFPEDQILSALLKDKIVMEALGDKRPKSLSELIKVADGGCEVSFYALNESFLFHHIDGNKVAIRIGLSHGCEVMRGNYTELGIYLPISPQLSKFLRKAEKKKMLGKNLNYCPNEDI